MSGFSLAHNLVLPRGSINGIPREGEVVCCVQIQCGFMLERVVTTLTWQKERGSWVFPSTSCTLGMLNLRIYQHMGNRTAEFEVAETVFMLSPGGGEKEIRAHTQEAAPTKAHIHCRSVPSHSPDRPSLVRD